jgi:hypothetical protein
VLIFVVILMDSNKSSAVMGHRAPHQRRPINGMKDYVFIDFREAETTSLSATRIESRYFSIFIASWMLRRIGSLPMLCSLSMFLGSCMVCPELVGQSRSCKR